MTWDELLKYPRKTINIIPIRLLDLCSHSFIIALNIKFYDLKQCNREASHTMTKLLTAAQHLQIQRTPHVQNLTSGLLILLLLSGGTRCILKRPSWHRTPTHTFESLSLVCVSENFPFYGDTYFCWPVKVVPILHKYGYDNIISNWKLAK